MVMTMKILMSNDDDDDDDVTHTLGPLTGPKGLQFDTQGPTYSQLL